VEQPTEMEEALAFYVEAFAEGRTVGT